MKADPLNLVLEKKHKLTNKSYFVTGNEISLIEKTKDILIKNISEQGLFTLEKIKNLSFKKNDVGLFNNNYLYVINDVSSVDDVLLDNISSSNDVYIFYCENSPKTKLKKNIFAKRPDSILFECYSMSKTSKIKVINKYINEFEIKIDEDDFWILVERLDDRYMFLENEINKFKELRGVKIDKIIINKILSNSSDYLDGLFFNILNKNEKIVSMFNKKITNQTEINKVYFVFKQFCLLIISNNSEKEFENSIPRYLFLQKSFLISLFRRYNNKKKRSLINLLNKTEKLTRINGEISSILILRFILQFKKITIS